MYMLHGFKSTQNRVRIISKVKKVLYSRFFFNVSSGAENVLKTKKIDSYQRPVQH